MLTMRPGGCLGPVCDPTDCSELCGTALGSEADVDAVGAVSEYREAFDQNNFANA